MYSVVCQGQRSTPRLELQNNGLLIFTIVHHKFIIARFHTKAQCNVRPTTMFLPVDLVAKYLVAIPPPPLFWSWTTYLGRASGETFLGGCLYTADPESDIWGTSLSGLPGVFGCGQVGPDMSGF
jgi:hypothetical protein